MAETWRVGCPAWVMSAPLHAGARVLLMALWRYADNDEARAYADGRGPARPRLSDAAWPGGQAGRRCHDHDVRPDRPRRCDELCARGVGDYDTPRREVPIRDEERAFIACVIGCRVGDDVANW